MTERMTALKLCRECLSDIRSGMEDVRMLKSAIEAMPLDLPELHRQLEQAEASLLERRRKYPWRMEKARQALGCVGDRERKALWLYYVLGMSAREGAAAMGVSEDWFKRLKAAGLRQLTGG